MNGSPVKVCRCRQCRAARARHSVMRQAWRRFRHMTRAALRRGVEPPQAIGGGYVA